MIIDTQLGCTVNLYPINNWLLINGKDVDRLMDKHLPLLHEMIIKAMREFGFRGAEAMNNILCEQMRNVASQRRDVVCSPTPVANETPCDSQVPDATSATQTNDSSMLKSADGGNTGKTLTGVRSSSRLLKQSQVQAKSDNRGKRQSDRHKPKTEDQCPVCSRNINSKAAHFNGETLGTL